MVHQSMFACRGHWFGLPGAIRHAIIDAYEKWVGDADAIGELRTEQAKAIAFWKQRVKA